MSGFILSPQAQRDLDDIWNYTLTQWGLEQATLYIRQIQAAIEAVAAMPTLGRRCDTIRPGYRRFPTGSHVLFFRLVPQGVDIVRILHSRMDAETQLG
jgi:toxin ParE1/3/4